MTRNVGVLIFPDFQILDAAGPIAAFEIAARYVPGAYAIAVLARDQSWGEIRSCTGP